MATTTLLIAANLRCWRTITIDADQLRPEHRDRLALAVIQAIDAEGDPDPSWTPFDFAQDTGPGIPDLGLDIIETGDGVHCRPYP